MLWFLFKSVAFLAVGLVMLIMLGIPLGTWLYVLSNASRTSATVLEKSEDVYHKYSGGWILYHRLKVRYSPRDTRMPEVATIDADEETWDQSKAGTRVEISYVPLAALRQIPMYYTRRLAEPLPPVWGAPDVQRSTTAMVTKIRHITKVGGPRRAVDAWQTFDVVEMRFVPAGRNEAVVAIDGVDTGSVSNLVAGQPIAIEYSSRRPRAVKIVGGRRDHVWKNNVEIWCVPVAIVLLFLFVWSWQRFPRAARTTT